MKRIVWLGVLVGLGAAWYYALPPAARTLAVDADAPLVRGAFHVHTEQSDGTGTTDEVAAAAARAGLRFVVLTDHGDGTRAPARPQYRQGVLMIDAVEVSTVGGHVIALGIPASPYPLGGEPRDVIDDIERLGGFSVAAHPDSPKPELRWLEWVAPFGGLEWVNGDSEWRDESAWSLARVLLTYPGRKAASIAAMLDRPETTLSRWDALTRRRRVVALAGADAHARLGLRGTGEPEDTTGARAPSLPLPSYEQTFRAFSITVPGVIMSGDAAADGKAVVDAIRLGHVYSVIDAIAGPAAMTFTARTPSQSAAPTAQGGDAVPITGAVAMRVDVQAEPDARIELLKDGSRVAMAEGARLLHVTGEPGVYRVEVFLPGAPGTPPVPWILSNPIYVGRSVTDPPPADPRGRATSVASLYGNGAAPDVRIENSADAKGAVDVVPGVPGTQLLMRYAIGGTASASPYAALVMPAGPGLPGHDRLMFTARADRPMRLSIQLRMPGGALGERWQRSVYLDASERPITVYFDDLTPVGVTSQRRPVLSQIDSVLFVVDRVNTALGSGGQIWIDDVKYAK